MYHHLLPMKEAREACFHGRVMLCPAFCTALGVFHSPRVTALLKILT